MPRDTSFDTITDNLIQGYVPVLSLLSGWGALADGSKAVYPHLDIPYPMEPFPAAYIYLAGQAHDYSQGTGIRRDLNTIHIRVIGGPITPGYRFNPWQATYQMITAVVNELSFRRYLEDPTNNNAPFRYVDPQAKLTVGAIGRITGINYGEQGTFVGIEIPTTIGLMVNIGRLS